jgi:hypothetical protein
MTRSVRSLLAPLALAATLGLGILPAAAPAQDPGAEGAPAEGESKGRPLDGYFATGALVGLALFLVGKSARR